MTLEGPPATPTRGLAIAVLAAIASGIVVALGDSASLPLIVVAAAAAAFAGSIVAFVAITYRDARSTGSSFGSALGRSFRTAGKMLVALMP